jgi:hypothetical protein
LPTARVNTPDEKFGKCRFYWVLFGERGGTRTLDPMIKSHGFNLSQELEVAPEVAPKRCGPGKLIKKIQQTVGLIGSPGLDPKKPIKLLYYPMFS